MSHQDEIFNLKTVEFAPDGGECVRRESALEVAKTADIKIVQMRAEITQAQEEIARLQSGIATLRERWQARRDAWKSEFDEEMNKRGYTAYAAILGGEWYATESVLEELDALFPPEVINEEKAS